MPEPFEPAEILGNQDFCENIFSTNPVIDDLSDGYTEIEGVSIKNSWMQLPDFPEPPDNIRTQDNAHQWDMYSLRIKQFYDKHSAIK